jgi:hypothetical protein
MPGESKSTFACIIADIPLKKRMQPDKMVATRPFCR